MEGCEAVFFTVNPRVHVLQHVAFETCGMIAEWVQSKTGNVSTTRLYESSFSFPSLDSFDILVVMGGPMNVYQHRDFPFLVPEKEFLKTCLDAGKRTLGICLGAQLIADALGGRVFQNPVYEFGWYAIDNDAIQLGSRTLNLSSAMCVMHLHGDTFSLPSSCKLFSSSEGCRNQGFTFSNHAMGLQFHLEIDRPLLTSILHSGVSDELDVLRQSPSFDPSYVSNVDNMIELCDSFVPLCRASLFKLMDFLWNDGFISEGTTAETTDDTE
eukprot:ANDGO_08528.mRNA.1 Putative glutamine amidotransferase-like protein YfeJ